MKSRKLAKVSKKMRSKKTRTADRYRHSLRSLMRSFETLEERQLLTVEPWSDGFFYPPIGLTTGVFVSDAAREQYASISELQYGTGGGSVSLGEGSQGFANASEIEPNNVPTLATFINVGTGLTQNDGVAIVGNLSQPIIPGAGLDEDWFAFDLQAGDIFEARVVGLQNRVFDLSIRDATLNEVIGNNASASGAYPIPDSPLTATNTNTDLAFVVPVSGRYFARLSDGDSVYTMTLRARRPVLESQPVGTKQTVFLDFDGAIINRDIFGVPGTGRLSPLRDFLPSWSLTAADENRIIDKIIGFFESRFFGPNAVSATGGNGHFGTTGVPGQFDLQILNSRDHADPFGQPNVSRIIIGGTSDQLGIPGIFGIAQSVDIGNFDTTETAVVLLDSFLPAFSPFPRAGNVPLEDILVEAIGNVVAHEAGHYFGAWHTLSGNADVQIMDTGDLADDVGIGPDGIYGTADDLDVHFGTDIYDAAASSIPFGRQNSAANMAWGLSTGRVGGATVRGNLFEDRNLNRTRDTGDVPLSNVTVYADANNNGFLDVNEIRVLSNTNGDYTITVPAGNYTIREIAPAGFRLLSPIGNGHAVSLATGQTLTGRDFTYELIDQSITGIKWNDVNGNGIRDAGEAGIAGVFIYVDLDGDNRIDIGEPTAQTKADGTYRLTFPGPGTFAVREVVPAGFTQTFPGPLVDNEHTIVLTGNPLIDGPRATGLNFGNRLTIDYGDAPASYGVAAHGILDGLRLGTLIDAESGPLFSADALGDDNDGFDDEDGIDISTTRPLLIGSVGNPVNVATTNNTGQTAFLHAWIDFNQDGDFQDAGEQVVANLEVGAGQLPTLAIPVPATALAGETFARLRLSLSRDLGPTDQVLTGEVEDYRISIVSEFVLAQNDTATVARNSVLNAIDVLANDFRSGNETLEVINVSNPSTFGGTVTFTPDRVVYTPASGFIGRDTFTYQMRNSTGEIGNATVTVDVNLFFENPLAVDDSFDLPTNEVDFPLNVLANDIEGQDGALSIVSVTQPANGGNVSIASGNKGLRYTPARGFGGTEMFTYTVQDVAGKRSTARVTVHTLPGDRSDDRLQIRLRATDLTGREISAIPQGQEFRLEFLVDDLRFPSETPATDIDAGVFAAYADILYNFQLVSTVQPGPSAPAGFNFDVQFDQLNRYTNGQSGDATVPGIIDEFGAFFEGTTLNRPNESRLASITLLARAPGVARFDADPADISPRSDSLLFDSANLAVPINQIRYLGTTLEIVGDGVVFPVAVDDSLATPIPANALQFPIDVLANDQPGSSAPITLQSVTNGLRGTTRINAGRVEYTPNTGFSGTDQFMYTIVDSRGTQSSAQVTVQVGTNTTADDIVGLRLEVTNTNGVSINQVAPGSQFQLRGYVRDLRTTGSNLGIFAAYQDILYSSQLVAPVLSSTNPLGFDVRFGETPQTAAYDRVIDGDVRTVGLINEIGAVSSNDSPLGTGEQLMFIITMQALPNVAGTATFIGDPADIAPFHDTLTFEPVQPVPISRITYGFDSVVIGSSTNGSGGEGEFTNWSNPLDVNADGFVSPIDALSVINALNSGGSRPLGGGGGEGEGGARFYVDTNADGFLSAIDVLNVINYLNSRPAGGSGEGEAGGEGEGRLSEDLLAGQSPLSTKLDQLSTYGAPETSSTVAPVSSTGIGVRETGAVQGPSPAEFWTAATDDLFGKDEEGLDDLLSELATEIQSRWKIA